MNYKGFLKSSKFIMFNDVILREHGPVLTAT